MYLCTLYVNELACILKLISRFALEFRLQFQQEFGTFKVEGTRHEKI